MKESIRKKLAGMTLEEKLCQLTQLDGSFLPDISDTAVTGPMSRLSLKKSDIDSLGSVLNIQNPDSVRKAQRGHMETDRNGIPLLFMHDIVHGCKTVYPIPLGMAASFSPDLMRECAEMAAEECKLSGVDVTFSPMVDYIKDARWGRVMESTGEDVYLNALYAVSQVKGYQSRGIASCIKHFAAYGAPEAGRDYNTVDMSERTLREYYLPAYHAAVDAGVYMVMTSFNSLNGIPAAANEALVRGILREEWGFDGVIISDYNAFNEMMTHGIAETSDDCAYLAMRATNDIEMMSVNYIHSIKKLIDDGRISMEQVDRAVERVLELKEKLKVFDNPYQHCEQSAGESCILSAEHRALARKAAEKSAVLLENKNLLPFSKDVRKIAVIGPFGDTGEIIGAWSGFGNPRDTVTLKDGIQRLLPNAEVITLRGVDAAINAKADPEEIRKAAELASDCDIVILTLGEPSGDSGEGTSKQNLELPTAQYELFRAVQAGNPNTAVVLFTGRPLVLTALSKECSALLNVWQPGTEGGTAIADLLFGEAEPEGRLTMSFPAATGQCPIHYNHMNTGRPRADDLRRYGYCSSYIDGPNEPLYPFGYGLGYTEFKYTDLSLSSDSMSSGDSLTASVTVTNVGRRAGTETVQLYLRDLVGSVVRPVKELKGFCKVTLAPGEKQTVSFNISEEMLKFLRADMTFGTEPGEFRVFIGHSSACTDYLSFRLK